MPGESITVKAKPTDFSDGKNRAVDEFLNDAGLCPYCGHDRYEHAYLIKQPHVYIRKEYGRKKILRRKLEVLTCTCDRCAREKNTNQVVCFMHNSGFGELV